ncbi:right-handed parallel beta-helix repeat-containing protein [Methylocystis heyeri]|uniref:Right handed beta helix domain-containing protein n=1 Tax=Methylocystis heyeri TaxID=391905 RepID=A0A6B8KBS3_9HYPH|nr:right-handed parallel beta-helix repeat-containing protein [Methylocystis heyeri]QGM45844.1 hypothetical protein H2LOC_009095 [Methylocystis heyeri]
MTAPAIPPAAPATVTTTLAPSLNLSDAATNLARAQAAVNAGGDIYLLGSGVAYHSAPLVLGSNTRLHIDPRLTIRQAPGTNKNVIQSACYTRAWSTITGITWSSSTPMLATINIGGGFTAAHGDFIVVFGQKGTTDGAFTGNFRVVDATDPANPVVILRRMPAAAPTGTIKAKLGDHDLGIYGGTIDYDLANNSGPYAASADLHAIVLFGVANSNMDHVRTRNSGKFGTCIAASNYFVGREFDHNGASDAVKVYGPTFDAWIEGVHSDNGDDVVSLHTEESATYASYDISGGDVLGCTVKNVKSYRGYSVALYSTDPAWYTDDNIFDGVSYHPANAADSPKTMIRLLGPNSGAAYNGSLLIRDVQTHDRFAAQAFLIDDAGGTNNFDLITVEDLSTDRNATIGLDQAPVVIQGHTGSTVKLLNFRRCRFYMPATADYGIYVGAGQVFGEISFDDCYITCPSSSYGTLFYNTTSSIDKINFNNNKMDQGRALARFVSTMGNVPQIVVNNNYVNAKSVIEFYTSAKVHMAGNDVVGMSGAGLYILAGNVHVTVSSGGGNIFPAGNQVYSTQGTSDFTFVGNCADFSVDLSAAYVLRSDSVFIKNTNAALGTLGSAGLVTGHGTASGSWIATWNTSLNY